MEYLIEVIEDTEQSGITKKRKRFNKMDDALAEFKNDDLTEKDIKIVHICRHSEGLPCKIFKVKKFKKSLL